MFEMINTEPIYRNTRGLNSTMVENEILKNRANKYAKCQLLIKNEKDPLKKEMMESRLALGITDFKDLK